MILRRPSRLKSRGLSGRLAVSLVTLLLAISVMQGCAVLERFTDAEPASLADAPPIDSRGADWPVLPREGGEDGYDDPFEDVNRVFFYVNGAFDFLVFEPLARFYRGFMPTDARHAISRAFTNLAEPVVAANHLLQLEGDRAVTSVGRLLVNSTVGIGGLFDVATDLGLEADDADFGQTLHHYGVGEGPYLVLPIFGPTTVRDAVGFGVDGLIDPRGHLLEPTSGLLLSLSEGVVRREEVIDPVDFLIEHALDHYDAVRAWNHQERHARAHRRLHRAQIRDLPRLFARVRIAASGYKGPSPPG